MLSAKGNLSSVLKKKLKEIEDAKKQKQREEEMMIIKRRSLQD